MNKYLLTLLAAGILAALSPGLFARGSDGRTDEVPSEVNQENAGDTEACGPGFRSVRHAMGESCVPDVPRRVVVLDTGEIDNALALGVPVVGAPVGDIEKYQAYLRPRLSGIADTGTILEPNLEAILSVRPDLILGSRQRYEAVYDELSAIAPTVFTESLWVPWQDNFMLQAEATGLEYKAEELMAEYENRVAEVRNAIGDNLGDTTVSVIRFLPGEVRLYLKNSYIGYILEDVGLRRPESQDSGVFVSKISLEQVRDADADYIFITGHARDDSELADFLESPLWQTLEGVKNGRAIDVNDDTWIVGLAIQAANMVLDDLERLITGAGS